MAARYALALAVGVALGFVGGRWWRAPPPPSPAVTDFAGACFGARSAIYAEAESLRKPGSTFHDPRKSHAVLSAVHQTVAACVGDHERVMLLYNDHITVAAVTGGDAEYLAALQALAADLLELMAQPQ